MKQIALLILLAAALAPSASIAAPNGSLISSDIAVSELQPGRLEIIYSGAKFTSRDQVERALLLSSAEPALAHGQQWFVLLALPGEMTYIHPPRRTPDFGAQFGHWQPHWNYYVSKYGWQWWHPEWGGEFWTKDVDPKLVERFEVHAMIELGEASGDGNGSRAFSAKAVVKELTRPSEASDSSAHHQK